MLGPTFCNTRPTVDHHSNKEKGLQENPFGAAKPHWGVREMRLFDVFCSNSSMSCRVLIRKYRMAYFMYLLFQYAVGPITLLVGPYNTYSTVRMIALKYMRPFFISPVPTFIIRCSRCTKVSAEVCVHLVPGTVPIA